MCGFLKISDERPNLLFVVSYGQAKQEQSYQRKLAEQRQREEQKKMSEIFGSNSFGLSNIQAPTSGSRIQTQNAGFGSGFGSFLSDVGSNIISPLSGIFSQVRPFISQQSVGQPALPTRSNLGGQESQQSGTQQAFVGGIPNILGQAAKFLRTPAGQVGTGLAGGIGASLLGGMNDMVPQGAVRNSPVITFTNGTAATRTVDVAVFIGG